MKKDQVKGRTLGYYGRIFILLSLLFISIGMLLQSLQINLMAQTNVDQVYAESVAQQMALSLRTRLEDTRRLQLTASNHPQTLNALREQDNAWVQSLSALLPGAASVELIGKNDDQQLQQRYRFSVQDLVNRTLQGEAMKLEAVRLENDLSFFWASPIKSSDEIEGVLLVQYDKNWLSAFSAAAATSLGQVSVRQQLDPTDPVGIQIMAAGSAPTRRSVPVVVPINEYWFLTFTPSDERPYLSAVSLSFPWFVTLLLTLVGLLGVLAWIKHSVHKNRKMMNEFLQQFFDNNERTPPLFSMKLYNDLTSELLKYNPFAGHNKANNKPVSDKKITKKNASTARLAEEDSTPTQPVSSNTNDLDISESITIDRLPVDASNNADLTNEPFKSDEEIKTLNALPERHIFRAYDIRGLADSELSSNIVRLLGQAIGSQVLSQGHKKISLAWDGRLSSPRIAESLQRGILSTGCDVVSLGMVPTGTLYFSTWEIDAVCGVMVTGSHNPAEYNGLKVVINRQPLSEQAITELYQRIQKQDFITGLGKVTNLDIRSKYLNRITDDVQLQRDFRVVIDAGNGVAGPMSVKLLRDMGVDVHPLYCEIDGQFPNHHPDPSKAENVQDLCAQVLVHKADLGIAFDGDGDRVTLVDNAGEIVDADALLMLFIGDILPRNPGRDVVYDVKSSRHIAPLVNQLGGRPILWKTGHSMLKQKLYELNAVLAGEFSGHYYLNERWYGFDDGLYVAARVLEILTGQELSAQQVFAQFPRDVSTPEITLACDDDKKFAVISALKDDAELLKGARVIDVDGLRIEFNFGWGLIRASNTTPNLTLRFAADSEASMQRIQQKIKQSLTRHAPEIQTLF
ncbi:MAG: phosphomannomutase/phosphoglucomutase [Oleibacter sp.]|nr:phosphomannomutase/phosphoglucomutase [Thalassolituus sp.]